MKKAILLIINLLFFGALQSCNISKTCPTYEYFKLKRVDKNQPFFLTNSIPLSITICPKIS